LNENVLVESKFIEEMKLFDWTCKGFKQTLLY